MMSELIDRNALIDALMTYTWRDEDEHLIDDCDEKRRFIEQWLPSLPTLKTELFRFGHWKKISPSFIYECSECGQHVLTSYIFAYKYCHHCGAKMEDVSE